MAFGRTADGVAATDAIVFLLSRPDAGTISPQSATLTTMGASAYFTPCSTSGNPACAGPARVQIALAAQPSAVVAESDEFQIVVPQGVGSTANCLPYAMAVFFDGNGWIYTGTLLVTNGAFTSRISPTSAPTHVEIYVDPASSSQGLSWTFDFASPSGAPALAAQVYNNAERYPFQASGASGMNVSGDGRGCNQLSGRFEIHELTVSDGGLTKFLATFEQFCENEQSNVLRGCVKYFP